MRLSSDVNLTFYAEKCDDYSGADLQALLYNAYLEAIRDVIDDSASIKQNTCTFFALNLFAIQTRANAEQNVTTL